MLDDARYVKQARRGEHGRVLLEMPAFYAICGSANASGCRTIDVASSGGGSDEGWKQLNYFATGHRGRIGRYISDADRMDLHKIEVPVCERHVTSQPVRADNDGTLRFVSYRYYKAFCVANDVKAPR